MTAISPTATGPRPIGPPLAEMQSPPRMAGASICCLAVAPTISGRACGRRSRAARWRTPECGQKNISLPTVRESLEWGPFESIGPDLVEGIRRIKSQDGPDLMLSGSSTLTSPLLEHGLADEVLLVVYPVLLGTGSASLRREPRHAHSSSSARQHCSPASSSVFIKSPGL